ncbi:hypothetical protein [Aureimonas sp. SA4125]|nr:hypothetical protein [Aureimonas sp. SA4125]
MTSATGGLARFLVPSFMVLAVHHRRWTATNASAIRDGKPR